MIDKIYQCASNERHVFLEETIQGLCPKCPQEDFSFLLKRIKGEAGFDEALTYLNTNENPPKQDFDLCLAKAENYLKENNFGDAQREYSNALNLNIDNEKVNRLKQEAKKLEDIYNKNQGIKTKEVGPIPKMEGQDAGLGILLMDVSDSMNQPAFKGAKITRLQMVAKSAAFGIHSLKEMSDNEFAFLHIYKFDHEVSPISFSSIKYLTHKYPTPEKLEAYLYEELSKRNGQTDINTALKIAYKESVAFANGKFKLLGDYEVKESSTPLKNGRIGSVKNISVLLYTDGLQYTGEEGEKIVNPFKDSKELDHDILIGAFIGDEKNKGCKELQEVLSDCVKKGHNHKQFFLVNNADQMKSFKRLFRMASGASGFCPQCLVNEHQDLMG